MGEIKTPKKYPWERALEELLRYLAMRPKTKLELQDKAGFYFMVSSVAFVFVAAFMRG